LERLAAANHKVYCDGLAARGETTPTAQLAYEALGSHEKEQNRQAVEDIPVKLARVGYVMIPAGSNDPPFDFPGQDLERLAEMEHERWMALKMTAGFRYGEENSEAKRTHQGLLRWQELPETEKEKDRDIIRGIPRVLAAAGYTIAKVQEDGGGA
jgi:hypothetical protein